MSSMNEKTLVNSFYEAVLITTGAVGFSFLSKKLLGSGLGAPSTPAGVLKLAGAVGASSVGVAYLHKKGVLPSVIMK